MPASEIKMAQLTLHLEDSLLLAAGSFNLMDLYQKKDFKELVPVASISTNKGS